MQEAFTRLFATVKWAAGYIGIAAAAIKTPAVHFLELQARSLGGLEPPSRVGW